MYHQLLQRGAAACAVLGIAAVVLAAQAPTPTPAQAADVWSSSTDCAACHVSQVQSVEGGSHEILACVGCHNDEKILADVHKAVDASSKMPRRLKKTEVAEATCLGCHGNGMIAAPQAEEKVTSTQTDVPSEKPNDSGATPDAKTAVQETPDAEEVIPHEALIAATAASTALTDENGTVVNPHDLPAVEDHASLTCVSCHKGHADDTIEESAMKACVLCHHESVFECYTCHE